MHVFIPEMKNLIKTFNKKQNKLLKETMSGEFDKFTVNYGVLGIALGPKLKKYSANKIKSFYRISDFKKLNPSDIMLSIIIMTLSDELGYDVKEVFDKTFTLDIAQPELAYLANLVHKVTQ